MNETGDGRFSLLGGCLPPVFEARAVAVAPGCERAYDQAECGARSSSSNAGRSNSSASGEPAGASGAAPSCGFQGCRFELCATAVVGRLCLSPSRVAWQTNGWVGRSTAPARTCMDTDEFRGAPSSTDLCGDC